MIDEDLDQKNRKESIQHYARKKRENVSLSSVLIALMVIMLFLVGIIYLLI